MFGMWNILRKPNQGTVLAWMVPWISNFIQCRYVSTYMLDLTRRKTCRRWHAQFHRTIWMCFLGVIEDMHLWTQWVCVLSSVSIEPQCPLILQSLPILISSGWPCPNAQDISCLLDMLMRTVPAFEGSLAERLTTWYISPHKQVTC
jgi:hypothetical protein